MRNNQFTSNLVNTISRESGWIAAAINNARRAGNYVEITQSRYEVRREELT